MSLILHEGGMLPTKPGPDPVTVEELLREFFASRSPNTLDAYEQDVRAFVLWSADGQAVADDAMPAARAQVLRELLESGPGRATLTLSRWRNEQLARGLASATVSRRLTTIRTLLGFARTAQMIAWEVKVKNPTAEAARDMSGPTRDEAMAMLRHVDAHTSSLKGARDRAIVYLLYQHGLRAGEVLSLDLVHLFLEPPEPHAFILGKGRRHRERVALTAASADALRGWVAQRGAEPGALFTGMGRDPARAGGRLLVRSVRRIVARLAADAGVTRTVRPHGLRHSAATFLWSATRDLLLVKEFLRHRNIATTQRYLDLHGEDYGLRGANLLASA